MSDHVKPIPDKEWLKSFDKYLDTLNGEGYMSGSRKASMEMLKYPRHLHSALTVMLIGRLR